VLRRVLRALRVTIYGLIAAAAVYGAAGVVLGLVSGVERAPEELIPWAHSMPIWPVAALLLAALLSTIAYSITVLIYRSRKGGPVRRLSGEAVAWPETPEAHAALSAGSMLARVTGFRAHPLRARAVELAWNPPLGEVDEVAVYRSSSGFATSPEPEGDQQLVCRGEQGLYVDAGLEDERVYFYTAFAHDHHGRWSAPAWTWTKTPRLRLL